MVVELGGTMTVVFAGGGGLLLLMQPASSEAATTRVDKIFIPVSAFVLDSTYSQVVGLMAARSAGREQTWAQAHGLCPMRSYSGPITFSHSHMSGHD